VVTGQGDLRVLELAGGVVESARGRFTVDVELRRGGGGWDVSGELRFDQAGLDVGAPVAIARASGRLTLSGTTVHIDQLEGRMGTGSFAVAGSIDLRRGPDLSWTLTDVGADPLPSLEVELSGRGSVDGTWEHLRVSGEIDVTRMLYDRDISLTDFLPSLNRALAAAPRPPSARRIDLDLHVVAPGELYVENNVARIEVRADLTIPERQTAVRAK
jgi:autotransporter translocation and assembly factor TamB